MEGIDEDLSIESVLVIVFGKIFIHYCIQDYSRELSHLVWFIFKMVYNSCYSDNSSKFKKFVIIHLVVSIIHLAYDIYIYLSLPEDGQLQHILIHLPSILHDFHLIFNNTSDQLKETEKLKEI
ncbi:hypothetical protein DICPUDRAFT_81435 [Dictyostelium purpureum]|uniref:Uncharacterized protein n=1 Tax=Dictyostelium purpureum TaxID=5786 RepID=F0ZTH0_DICPU|nr:uncharacterized protein DICPUDRAFT_81435 [Dictyostelium purpureum]EGC32749.1 hypothetical protein DICPUDRAFT_81435 [Dictyostelium purpureum]|eukprot:XP_003290712.1 hypothetical protein DICPUDRAFT_81435 [Dictyostelium purpureum]